MIDEHHVWVGKESRPSWVGRSTRTLKESQ